jgi:hypothetical protein
MSRVITEVPVQKFFSDRGNTVMRVALKAQSSIISVNIGKHHYKLGEVIIDV